MHICAMRYWDGDFGASPFMYMCYNDACRDSEHLSFKRNVVDSCDSGKKTSPWIYKYSTWVYSIYNTTYLRPFMMYHLSSPSWWNFDASTLCRFSSFLVQNPGMAPTRSLELVKQAQRQRHIWFMMISKRFQHLWHDFSFFLQPFFGSPVLTIHFGVSEPFLGISLGQVPRLSDRSFLGCVLGWMDWP